MIPHNADAWEVILALYRRSRGLGGLFSLSGVREGAHRPYAPSEDLAHSMAATDAGDSMTAMRTPARPCRYLLRSGCKADTKDIKSPFDGFRFHDLRHQAITELAESKASDQTIMGIAGHVSKKMLQHYSHVRM